MMIPIVYAGQNRRSKDEELRVLSWVRYVRIMDTANARTSRIYASRTGTDTLRMTIKSKLARLVRNANVSNACK